MIEKNTEIEGATPAPEAGAKETPAPSQETGKKNEPKSELEKASYSLKSTAKRIKELGGVPEDILGVRPNIKLDDTLPDDAPLTVGAFREMQKQDAKKSALQMANELKDEGEREEVKRILNERIMPSGDAQADYELALAAANARRTTQVAQEITRKTTPRRTAAGAGAPSVSSEDDFEPTASESVFMRPPYNMTKERILEARKKAQEKQQ